jgi:hypothetical protein
MRTTSVLVATAWLAAAGAASAAGPAPRFSFRGTAESAECGLRLAVFGGAQARSLPAAETFTYRSQAGDVQQRFVPRDLWMARTWRGRWEDRSGNAVTLAEIDRPLPGPFPQDHVTAAQFEQAYGSLPAVSGADALVGWAEAFAGRKADGPPFPVPGGMRLADVQGIALSADGAGVAVGYAFRLRPGPMVSATGVQFFALFETREGTLPALRAALEREALPGIAPIPRRTPAASDHRFQNERTTAGAARDAEADASRAAALRSIEGLKGWWHVETTNYVFVSDLPGVRASLVKQMQADVEALRGAFTALLPPFEPIRSISIIRVFHASEDYLRYMGPEAKWSGGMWMPSKRELVVRPIDFGSVRERKDWLLGVVHHETLHQYLFYAYRAAEIPTWYNEGHAMLFEGAEVGRDGIEIGESERRAKKMDELVADGGPDFARVVALSHEEFYVAKAASEKEREINYAVAWALVYFLRKASPPDRPYAAALDRCRAALQAGKNGDAATAAAFEGVDMKALSDDFREFWKSPTRRSAARRLDLLAPSR